MPAKRKGLTQLSVQVPDGLLAAAHVARGARPLNTYLCLLLAGATGATYTPPARGRPTKAPAPKPARKPRTTQRTPEAT